MDQTSPRIGEAGHHRKGGNICRESPPWGAPSASVESTIAWMVRDGRITHKEHLQIKEAMTEQSKRYYVTMTWDNWPEGGTMVNTAILMIGAAGKNLYY